MIETRRLKNVVIFVQTILSFVLSRKIILEIARLLKCLKSPVSALLWTVNMLKCPKDCLSQHGRIFVLFFDLSGIKSARKVLS